MQNRPAYITLCIFITVLLQQYWQLMECQWEKSCLKGLFLLDSTPGHAEPHEFNTEGIEVVLLPPNTTSLIHSYDQEVIGTIMAHYK